MNIGERKIEEENMERNDGRERRDEEIGKNRSEDGKSVV